MKSTLASDEKLLRLDLTCVIQRMINLGWTSGDAEVCANEYKRYLFLRRKYPQHESRNAPIKNKFVFNMFTTKIIQKNVTLNIINKSGSPGKNRSKHHNIVNSSNEKYVSICLRYFGAK